MIHKVLGRTCGIALATCVVLAPLVRAQERLIEVLADKDSRYKIAGERTPEITVKAGAAGSAPDHRAQIEDLESRRIGSWILAIARQRPVQDSGLGSVAQARHSRVPFDRALGTGRVCGCVHRNMQ